MDYLDELAHKDAISKDLRSKTQPLEKTLLDEVAMSAMSGFISNQKWMEGLFESKDVFCIEEYIVKKSYKLADEFIQHKRLKSLASYKTK